MNLFTNNKNTDKIYKKAKRYISGGVTAGTRLNRAIACPFYISKGKGSKVWDIEGKEYIDFCTSHGASMLGHKHPAIVQAVQKSLDLGIICSAETKYHTALSRLICEVVPCAELVRYAVSGTEATLHGIRACRSFTGKNKIIRFEGHFHGTHDYVHIGGRVPREYLGSIPPYRESDGIPEEICKFVISIPFNDPDVLEKTIKKYKDEVCCVILEPINYNCCCIVPKKDYMKAMRELTKKYQIPLFYDEIQSAFKTSPGGAQRYFGIKPDIAVLGKSVGGGIPLSVICGRKEIMECFEPVGTTSLSGTFTSHLVAIMAGIAFQKEIRKLDFYEDLYKKEDFFYKRFKEIIAHSDIKARLQYHGPRFSLIMGIDEEVKNYRQSLSHSKEQMLKFVKECINRGLYFHDYGGTPVHHGFSSAHSMEDLEKALNIIEDVFKVL